MTKVKVDYNTNQTVLYKIVCRDPKCDYVYIGSTTNVTKRKCYHKNNCNNLYSNQYNKTLYQKIRDNGGWNNFILLVFEIYPCESKQHLAIRELYHTELQNEKRY